MTEPGRIDFYYITVTEHQLLNKLESPCEVNEQHLRKYFKNINSLIKMLSNQETTIYKPV